MEFYKCGYSCVFSVYMTKLYETMGVAMGVAVATFSFRFHVWCFPVGYWLTVSYLTKHDNQIVSIL